MTARLEYVIRLLARAPTGCLYPLASLFALLLGGVIRYRRRVIDDNLRAAFPALGDQARAALARAVYRNLADLAVEIIRATRIERAELERRVEVDGLELVEAEVKAGRTVILLAVHQCNWEWLLLRCSAALDVPVWALYKPLHDCRVDAMMARARARFGAQPVIARDVFAELVKAGQEPRVIAMVADQIPPREDEKHWARFFDRDTAFYVGPAKLARMTRATVMFAGMRRLGRGRYRVRIEPLTTPPYSSSARKVMDAYVQRAEALVREDPGAWLWSHRRWKYKKPLYG